MGSRIIGWDLAQLLIEKETEKKKLQQLLAIKMYSKIRKIIALITIIKRPAVVIFVSSEPSISVSISVSHVVLLGVFPHTVDHLGPT